MKVILTENVPHVGSIGEIVNVRNGYGRNYLIPRGLASLADEAHQKQLKDQLKRLNKRINAAKELATLTKNRLSSVVLQFIKRVGSNGKLFGSVTTNEIASKLKEEHEVLVENKLIVLSSPIRKLGVYDAKVKLFPEIDGMFKIKVVADPESLPKEKEKKGKGKGATKKDATTKKATASKEEVDSEEDKKKTTEVAAKETTTKKATKEKKTVKKDSKTKEKAAAPKKKAKKEE